METKWLREDFQFTMKYQQMTPVWLSLFPALSQTDLPVVFEFQRLLQGPMQGQRQQKLSEFGRSLMAPTQGQRQERSSTIKLLIPRTLNHEVSKKSPASLDNRFSNPDNISASNNAADAASPDSQSPQATATLDASSLSKPSGWHVDLVLCVSKNLCTSRLHFSTGI